MACPSARNSGADALINWLAAEGADLAPITVGASAYGGLGVCAATALPAGAVAFRCPCSVVLTAAAALDDPLIGPPLRHLAASDISPGLDDPYRLMLLLLAHRAQGASSRWAPYIAALPGDELPASLPLHWPATEASELLAGTPLLAQASKAAADLAAFHREVVMGRLCATWPDVFPPHAYDWPSIAWAYAIFWSRAIMLPLPGGSRACLVPLLDLCNHSASTAARVNCERMAPREAAIESENDKHAACQDVSNSGELEVNSDSVGGASGHGDGEHCFVLRLARPAAAGDELHINYGAKGNAELLRCHGFALPDNPADVYELDLGDLEHSHELLLPRVENLENEKAPHLETPADEAFSARLQELRRCSAARHFLYRGGLPIELLPAIRLLCADDGDERRRAEAALDGNSDASNEAPATSFDWSLVDWTADDPFAVANAAATPQYPCGAACEVRALTTLSGLLNTRLTAMQRACTKEGPSHVASSAPSKKRPPNADTATEAAASGGDGGALAQQRAAMARTYVEGQVSLLAEALGLVTEELARAKKTLEASADRGNTMEHAGSEPNSDKHPQENKRPRRQCA